MDKEGVTEISEEIKRKSKVHRASFLNKDRAVKKRNVRMQDLTPNWTPEEFKGKGEAGL